MIVGARTSARPGALAEDLVYNGATDNAAGTAFAIAVGSRSSSAGAAVRRHARDAEEEGLFGSRHFEPTVRSSRRSFVAEHPGRRAGRHVARATFAINSNRWRCLRHARRRSRDGTERLIAAPAIEVARLSPIFGQLGDCELRRGQGPGGLLQRCDGRLLPHRGRRSGSSN